MALGTCTSIRLNFTLAWTPVVKGQQINFDPFGQLPFQDTVIGGLCQGFGGGLKHRATSLAQLQQLTINDPSVCVYSWTRYFSLFGAINGIGVTFDNIILILWTENAFYLGTWYLTLSLHVTNGTKVCYSVLSHYTLLTLLKYAIQCSLTTRY